MDPLNEKLKSVASAAAYAEEVFGSDLEDLRWREDGRAVLFDPALGVVILESHEALDWVSEIARGGNVRRYRGVTQWRGAQTYRRQFLLAAGTGSSPLV